nr:hypothetical protein BaRGS_024846 [Batillaria attramentaria]
MNVVTSFIDASTVYGSDNERFEKVKDKGHKGYLMKMTEDDYLPDNGMDDCIKRGKGDYCFLAGDERVNEHPGLSVLHTVFARLHNRIAHMVRYMRPLYSHEDIFQRTRAIVIAICQKIMYADWLPVVLGKGVMKDSGLAVGPEFPRPKYDAMVDPTIPSSFGAAVFRFGHTLIPRTIPMNGQQPLLRDLFFKPFMVRGNMDSVVFGLTSGLDLDGRTQHPDAFIVEERGRDHGLPPYNDFREFCGLRRIETFFDPAMGISQKALAAVYSHPDDIDLFSGGMAEPPAYGGLVGETFNCLMRKVFYNLKYGDRFFYETKGEKASFADDELDEIRKVTLAQILCQTSAIKEIQVDAFRVPGPE